MCRSMVSMVTTRTYHNTPRPLATCGSSECSFTTDQSCRLAVPNFLLPTSETPVLRLINNYNTQLGVKSTSFLSIKFTVVMTYISIKFTFSQNRMCNQSLVYFLRLFNVTNDRVERELQQKILLFLMIQMRINYQKRHCFEIFKPFCLLSIIFFLNNNNTKQSYSP